MSECAHPQRVRRGLGRNVVIDTHAQAVGPCAGACRRQGQTVCVDLGGVPHITDHANRAVAQFFSGGHDAVFIDIRQNNLSAIFHQRFRTSIANALGAAGYQRKRFCGHDRLH